MEPWGVSLECGHIARRYLWLPTTCGKGQERAVEGGLLPSSPTSDLGSSLCVTTAV